MAKKIGSDILSDGFLNRDSAFSVEDRSKLKINGLLPYRVEEISLQEKRVLNHLRSQKTELDKYVFLRNLQDSNETLFFHLIVNHLEEIMPIIYTPIVGLACENFSHIYQRPRGLHITPDDKGKIGELIRNYPTKDVKVIVVTDGERILGLGDLGANGMGIPIGKLGLYTACAGVRPEYTLPVMFDVGTNTEKILQDPLYIGYPKKRIVGKEYEELIDEFITECNKHFPGVLIQFEDFGNQNAFELLERYKDRICCFNDDIQGTASVAFSGILCSLRVTGTPLKDQRFLFLGAGEAALGIAKLIVFGLKKEGMTEKEAKELCWFVDSTGLVENSRKNLNNQKKEFAHEHEPIPSFLQAIHSIKPTAIIGVSGQPKTFTQEVVEAMCKYNEMPIIFSLSNPTSKAECTAEEAYTWSNGKCIFSSGSPFPPVTMPDGRVFVPGQGNNSYVFPAIGFSVIITGSKRVTEEMFYVTAKSLSDQVTDEDLKTGCAYPSLKNIRKVSAKIALDVCNLIFERQLASIHRPENLEEFIKQNVYEPVYPTSSNL